eukprot:3390544-Rhodomonas_salina.1
MWCTDQITGVVRFPCERIRSSRRWCGPDGFPAGSARNQLPDGLHLVLRFCGNCREDQEPFLPTDLQLGRKAQRVRKRRKALASVAVEARPQGERWRCWIGGSSAACRIAVVTVALCDQRVGGGSLLSMAKVEDLRGVIGAERSQGIV